MKDLCFFKNSRLNKDKIEIYKFDKKKNIMISIYKKK
jgi:ribosomal protein L33